MNGNRRTYNNPTPPQTSSGGKNPYELRTELLNLAYQICYNQHVSEEQNNRITDGSYDANDAMVPRTTPTTGEVIECATQLNDFISQKTGGGNPY